MPVILDYSCSHSLEDSHNCNESPSVLNPKNRAPLCLIAFRTSSHSVEVASQFSRTI